MVKANRPMKVSDEARKAAEALFYLACDGADKGHIEEAFARFEADVRKDERRRMSRAIEAANVVAGGDYGSVATNELRAAIRSLSDDGESG